MGGCRCSFRSCERRTLTHPDTHYFHYPWRKRERCEQWARNAGHPEFMTLPDSQLRNKVVCQEHFRDACFMNYLHNSLTKFAVPTIERFGSEASGYVMDYGGECPVRETMSGERIYVYGAGESGEQTTAEDDEDGDRLRGDFIVDFVDEEADQADELVTTEVEEVDELLPLESAEFISGDVVEETILTGETIETPADAKFITKQEYSIITTDGPCSIASIRTPPKILNGGLKVSSASPTLNFGTLKKLTKVTIKKRPATTTTPKCEPQPKVPRIETIVEESTTSGPSTSTANDPKAVDLTQTLTDELRDIKAELERKKAEIAQQRQTIAKCEMQIGQLKSTVINNNDGMQQKCDDLQKKIDEQAAQLHKNDRLQKINNDLRKTNDSQAAQLENERTQHAKQMDVQRRKIRQQSQQIDALEAKIAVLQANLDDDTSSEAFQQQIDLLQLTNDEQKRCLELQQQQIVQLQKQAAQQQRTAATTSPTAPGAVSKAKPEKIVPMSKPQLFNGIRRYLNPSMISLLRMEMFADAEREYKPDERQIAMELWAMPAVGDAPAVAGSVYEFMRSEWRFRLPPKGEVLQWISERDENAGEEVWDDC